MSGLKITYGDYAPEAKENFVSNTTDKANFVDLSQLQEYNLDILNYANPCEYGEVLLDSSTTPFPTNPDNTNMGYWSNSISTENKTFTNPIVLTMIATSNFSSQGLTFTFDTYNNIFPKSINIKWYNNTTLLDNKDFVPDSAFYFCNNKVESFNKIVLTFNSMNMPYNRLKIYSIDFGYGTEFSGDELSNVKVIQEINTLSSELSINVVDFTLKSKNDFEYSFQTKQPLAVYYNNNLIQTCYIENSKRKGKREWEVNSNDYIGLLDTYKFLGNMYLPNKPKNAKDLLVSIFEQVGIPYEIDSSFNSKTLIGWLPICTCRQAVSQICFAIGAVVDTSYSDKIRIYPLPTTIQHNIELKNIMQGQNFDTSPTVTAVSLTAHTYDHSETQQTELYKAADSGTGSRVYVEFGSPYFSLMIEYGAIIESNCNYAIIDAINTNCVLYGYKYKDITNTKTINNPNTLANDADNIVEFNNYTLINSTNIDDILTICYNNSIKNVITNLSIIEPKSQIKYGVYKYGEVKYGEYMYGSSVKVGENITAETEYLGTLSGRIISQRYNMNGGILIKECEMV